MTPDISTSSHVVVSKDQVSCDLAGEAVILNLKDSIYYGLDEVGARIWHLIQQRRSVAELRDTLASEYDVEPSQCEADVIALLGKLAEHGLVEVGVAQPA